MIIDQIYRRIDRHSAVSLRKKEGGTKLQLQGHKCDALKWRLQPGGWRADHTCALFVNIEQTLPNVWCKFDNFAILHRGQQNSRWETDNTSW